MLRCWSKALGDWRVAVPLALCTGIRVAGVLAWHHTVYSTALLQAPLSSLSKLSVSMSCSEHVVAVDTDAVCVSCVPSGV